MPKATRSRARSGISGSKRTFAARSQWNDTPRERLAVKGDRAGHGGLQTENHSQERRLPRSVRANESREFAGLNAKVDVAKYHPSVNYHLYVSDVQNVRGGHRVMHGWS